MIAKLFSLLFSAVLFFVVGMMLMHHVSDLQGQAISQTQAVLDVHARQLEAFVQMQLDDWREEISELAMQPKLLEVTLQTEKTELPEAPQLQEAPLTERQGKLVLTQKPAEIQKDISVTEKLNSWQKNLVRPPALLIADLQGRVLGSNAKNSTVTSVDPNQLQSLQSNLFSAALSGQMSFGLEKRSDNTVYMLAATPVFQHNAIAFILLAEKPFKPWPTMGPLRSLIAVKNQTIFGELPFETKVLAPLEGKAFLAKENPLGVAKTLGIRLPDMTSRLLGSFEAGIWARTFRLVNIDGAVGYVALDNTPLMRRLHHFAATIVVVLSGLWLLHALILAFLGLRTRFAIHRLQKQAEHPQEGNFSDLHLKGPLGKLAHSLDTFKDEVIVDHKEPEPNDLFGSLLQKSDDAFEMPQHLPKLGDLLDTVEPIELDIESAVETPDHFLKVFNEFIETRKNCGEAGSLSFDKFKHRLEQSRADVMAKHHCADVRFQVYVKDGKAALKATPVND